MRPKFGLLVSLILVSWTIGSCSMQDQYAAKSLPPNVVDSTYTKRTFEVTGTFAGEHTTYYIKSSGISGMLAICALRIESTGNFEELMGEWFWNAFVFVGNATTKVARSKFIASVPEGKPRSEWWANCIETKTPADARLLSAPVAIFGDGVEVWN